MKISSLVAYKGIFTIRRKQKFVKALFKNFRDLTLKIILSAADEEIFELLSHVKTYQDSGTLDDIT